MALTLDEVAYLTSARGHVLLDVLAAEDVADSETLRLLTRLRRQFPDQPVGAALEQTRLRRKAAAKFGADAARMLFTREALEQASDPQVRAYRGACGARRRVIDAGCSIGSDALAFARAGGRVLGLDRDPVRVALARHNAEVLGLADAAQFAVADLLDGLPAEADDANLIFFDPARRDGAGSRIFDVERYQPPLSLARTWLANRPDRAVVVKLGPGIDTAQLAAYDGGLEFISVDGDLKEALLWLNADWRGRRAVLLQDGAVMTWSRGDQVSPPQIRAPRGWLVEPDPSLLRAGLVSEAAQRFGGTQLDETIAYFTTDERPDSPWLRAWRILEWMPFHVKRLRAALRERSVGQVTVKKRGSPLTPEALMPQLKLRGQTSLTLVLTRWNGKPIVLLCEDYEGGGSCRPPTLPTA